MGVNGRVCRAPQLIPPQLAGGPAEGMVKSDVWVISRRLMLPSPALGAQSLGPEG